MQLVHRTASRDGGRRSRLVVLALGVVAAAGAMTAGAGPAGAAGTPPGGSWVRAADLVTGAGPMQVTLSPANGSGGTPVVLSQGIGYGQATGYRALPPGSYTVTVTGAGPVLSSTYDAPAGGAVTLAALGTAQAPRLAVLQDDLTAPAAGSARVRVLPAAGAAPVDVSATNGPTIASGAVFGQPTAYASVPAGPWRLAVRTAGGPTDTQPADLASGAVYTVLVVNGTAGRLQTSVLEDAAGTAIAPKGGVATGGGGAATQLTGTSPATRTAGVGALGGLALLGLAVVGHARRRPALPRG